MAASRILVVEDDPRLAATVERVLVAGGHDVEVAGDGNEALRTARERPFDLVVLDILLPGLDGIAVCRRIRATSQVPIRVLVDGYGRLLSAIPALVAALLASWLVAGRALAPLKAVAVAAEDVGRTRDLGRRLPAGRSRDEVATLAASFNTMLSRLQDAFESQRRFVADASHELRTPLTTIRGNAGLLAAQTVTEEVRRAAAADVVEESARMARLVDRMLTLARADAGMRLRVAPVAMQGIVEEVCRQAAAQHPDMHLAVDAADATVDGDEDALRQLIWILLDNAFRYARTSVAVRLTVHDGWARIVVADDGPGIAAGLRDRVFDRFFRADESRSGPHGGLGLSIARWIAAEHGGRIVAGEALLGGAALLVDLPLLRGS